MLVFGVGVGVGVVVVFQVARIGVSETFWKKSPGNFSWELEAPDDSSAAAVVGMVWVILFNLGRGPTRQWLFFN